MVDPGVSLTVARLVEEMSRAGIPPDDDFWSRLATQIGKAFKAEKHEVAILRLSADRKMIRFLFPIRLSKVGTIPLTAVYSLATKTVREKRGEIVNNFAAYQHPTVFESVALSEKEKATPIQKIVSAPMIVDGTVIGVIEISRKGMLGEAAGPDFVPQDLSELMAVGAILGKYLTTLPSARSC